MMIVKTTTPWESQLFGFPILQHNLFIDSFDPLLIEQQLLQLLKTHPSDTLHKFHLDAKYIILAPFLERLGCELWETRFIWRTILGKRQYLENQKLEPVSYKILKAKKIHYHIIVDLVIELIAKSKSLMTRFNSPFYPDRSTEQWYRSWVVNMFEDPSVIISITEHVEDKQIVGFFIYKKMNNDVSPLFKGILSAVLPSHRGFHLHIHMQNFIFDEIFQLYDTIELDNTTQISNYPVIRNHAASHRKPENIELVFFKGPKRKSS